MDSSPRTAASKRQADSDHRLSWSSASRTSVPAAVSSVNRQYPSVSVVLRASQTSRYSETCFATLGGLGCDPMGRMVRIDRLIR